jgi:hypothetical protein
MVTPSTPFGVSAGRFTLFRVVMFDVSAVQRAFGAGSIPGSSSKEGPQIRRPFNVDRPNHINTPINKCGLSPRPVAQVPQHRLKDEREDTVASCAWGCAAASPSTTFTAHRLASRPTRPRSPTDANISSSRSSPVGSSGTASLIAPGPTRCRPHSRLTHFRAATKTCSGRMTTNRSQMRTARTPSDSAPQRGTSTPMVFSAPFRFRCHEDRQRTVVTPSRAGAGNGDQLLSRGPSPPTWSPGSSPVPAGPSRGPSRTPCSRRTASPRRTRGRC